jgi:D-3-phosphoglycerate dehydrogenase
MKIKVSNVAFSQNQFLVEELMSHFPDVIINSAGVRLNNEELVEYFSDADAVIVGLEKITAEILDQLPNLKMIAKYGVGLDNIDLKACKERNVAIGWTGGVNKRSVAEMAIGFMLALSRNLYVTSNQLKKGTWNKSGGTQLTGKTIGIIGLGNIGKELVQLLKPFQCKILVNDILDINVIAQQLELTVCSKEEIYAQSDIISVHTPLTAETHNLFNMEVFKKMKPSAFLLNTARGGIINESDLKYALKNAIIGGAALDVFDPEPPVDEELLSIENLINTPHTGGNSYEAVVGMGMSAIEHLLRYKQMNFNKI